MLRIWGRTSSINVQKVMWAVGELGLEHERIDCGGKFAGLDTPEMIARNPNRLIPILEDGGTVIWESNAIVRYLAARYGSGTLWPDDPATRSQADRWMDWQAGALHRELGPIFLGLVRTPEPQRDHAAIAAAAERMGPLWRILDDHLADRHYVVGPSLTMGDIPVGCAYWRYVNLDVPRPTSPNLQIWFQHLKERDAYRHQVMLPLT